MCDKDILDTILIWLVLIFFFTGFGLMAAASKCESRVLSIETLPFQCVAEGKD